jgi:hypothetical protein
MIDADFGGNLLSTWKDVYEKEPIDQIITRFDWEDSVNIIASRSPAEPSLVSHPSRPMRQEGGEKSKQPTCQRTDTGARSVPRNFCGNSKRVDTMLRPNLQLRVGLGKVQLSDMSIHSALSISAL